MPRTIVQIIVHIGVPVQGSDTSIWDQIIATKKGEHTWLMTEQHMQAAEAQVLSSLPELDAATFRDLLQPVAVAANQRDPVDNPCDLVTHISADATPAAPRRQSHRRSTATANKY
jgi:hypothetical protein